MPFLISTRPRARPKASTSEVSSIAAKGDLCYHAATRTPRTSSTHEDDRYSKSSLGCCSWVVLGVLSTRGRATSGQVAGGPASIQFIHPARRIFASSLSASLSVAFAVATSRGPSARRGIERMRRSMAEPRMLPAGVNHLAVLIVLGVGVRRDQCA